MRTLLVVAVLSLGCSQHVYSPPSRAFGFAGGIRALPANRTALDLETSRHAEIFDPAIDAAAGRLREGVGDNTEASVEGTVMTVDDHGPSTADRRIFAGRAALRTNPSKGPYTFFGGIGGGYAPAGGSFVTADTGIAVGFENCVLVPVASASAGFSQPLHPRAIDVSDEANDYDVATPRRTFSATVGGGLRLSLSPHTCRTGAPAPWLVVGAGVTNLVDVAAHASLFGIGLGIEIPL